MNSNNSAYGAAPKRFQMPICDKSISGEFSNDYTLPDYQPEIRRVLRIDASILPPAKYIGGSSAELSGNIDYQMLYVGSDGEIYSAPLNAEYSLTSPLDISSDFDLNEGVILLCDIRDDSISTRVSGPRKLNIKCRLICRMRAYGIMVADEKISGETNPLCIERLGGECECATLTSGFGETVEIIDEISMASENTRVISASSEAYIDEISTTDSGADCRGDVNLKLLVSKGESSPAETVSRKISFGESIELEELTPDSLCLGRTYVGDTEISVEDDKIVCRIGIIPEIRAYTKGSIEYTKDIYSTENYSETAQRSYSIPRLNGIISGNFSQSERVPTAQSNIRPASKVIDSRCKPYIEKCEFEKGKAILLGESKYSIIIECEDEYSSFEIALPFRYECDCANVVSSDFSANADVLSCKVKIDGGNLCIDTELSISGELFGSGEMNMLSEVRFGEAVKKNEGDIIICYPSSEDSAWSVAKKYSVSPSNLSGISDASDNITGINYLVVNM